MKRIDWMVLRMLISPLVMSFFIVLFILVMQFMYFYINEVLGKGLDPAVLGQLVFYACGRMALLALPIAVLASSLMTFGAMGEHYELAAMKSTGMNLFKIMRSSLAFAVVLTVLSLWFSLEVAPRANLKFFSLFYDIQRKKADLALKPGYFYSDIDGYAIRISNKSKTGTLYDVQIYNHSENRGSVDVILADSARMYLKTNALKMVLYHGVRHEDYRPEPEHPESFPYGRTYFDSLIYQFTLQGFALSRTDETQFRHQITLNGNQLQGAIDSIGAQRVSFKTKAFTQLGRYNKVDSSFVEPDKPVTKPSDPEPIAKIEPGPLILYEVGMNDRLFECIEPELRTDVVSRSQVNIRAVKSYLEFMVKKKEDQNKADRSYRYEYYQRFSLPVITIFFMLIGASLGAIIRKGGLGAPSLISILLFVIFYILTSYGRKFAKEDVWEPWFGAWVPIIVFAPLAVYFTHQATTDARLFDESAWAMWRDTFRNLVERLRRKR
ncbi:MAG: YjgP/YjgQ family permease [Bacteroidetes bacterium]|nr:MAG: YjgP/YjgQ family permease [Bacteroidota bacterium]